MASFVKRAFAQTNTHTKGENWPDYIVEAKRCLARNGP
jgi:hypothetical protein